MTLPELSNPFVSRPLPRASWWRRLLRMTHPQGAAVALENLLATGRGGAFEVTSVLLTYGLRGERTRAILKAAFQKALVHFLEDEKLDDLEYSYLGELKRQLDLSDLEVEQVQQEVVHPRYTRRLADVMADGTVSAEERASLEELSKRLRLPDDVRRRLFASAATAAVEKTRDGALQDRRLSPTEEEDLKAIAASLGVDLPVSDGLLSTMERYRLFWRIDNEQMPVVATRLTLGAGEACHFETPATWAEYRTTVDISFTRVRDSSVTVRGARWHGGSIRPTIETSERMREVDTGQLYLTSRRVIFDGAMNNLTIPLTEIISFRAYDKGIQVERESGRSPMFFFQGDVELAGVMLSSLLKKV